MTNTRRSHPARGTTERMATMAATVHTPATLAEKLGSDPKTVRKFLRSITPRDEQPGKGSRWSIDGKQVPALRKQFVKWNAEQEKLRAERAAQRAAEAQTAAVEVETEPVETEAVDETISEEELED